MQDGYTDTKHFCCEKKSSLANFIKVLYRFVLPFSSFGISTVDDTADEPFAEYALNDIV